MNVLSLFDSISRGQITKEDFICRDKEKGLYEKRIW